MSITPSSPTARTLAAALAGASLAAVAAVSAAPPAAAAEARAGRRPPAVASYVLRARLDPGDHRVAGRETLRWRNASGAHVQELCFHLYLNGFRSTATAWTAHADREDLATLAGGGWGWIEIEELAVDGRDRLAGARFDPPAAWPEDRTVMRVPLDRPVAPGETVEVAASFVAQLPRAVARTGYRGDFHFVAQWFPKIAVLSPDGEWRCEPFHRNSEFFADYGDYDVTLDVPRRFVVGATGRRASAEDAGDGRTLHRYVQEGVHDFAWTAWPELVESRFTFQEEGLPPVDVRMLLRPETERFAARYARALSAGLSRFGAWFGPYPYSTLTMVDPPWGAEAAGGMEYPTLIATGTRVFSPLVTLSPESVTVHELGHQWFYGLLASDEVRESFLDEGITTYATGKLLAETYGPRAWSVRAFGLPVPFAEVRMEHLIDTSARYFRDPSSDPIGRTAGGYLDHSAYRYLTYSKMSLALGQLERLLGSETMERAMRAFAEAWRFRHPTSADFVRSLSRGAGQDLTGYFRQTLWSSEALDYAVTTAESRPRRAPAGVFGRGAERTVEERGERLPGWESEVVVRRLGGVTLPVHTDLVFADGQRARLRWDGRERWVRFRVVGPKLLWAEVDPDETMILDVDRLNNSLRVEPDRRASRRWGQRLRFWIQNTLETFAALA
ncbi:MAG TPA: M1 family metallopeptidase [Thermoanaerobaculia bacterium]|nr:M1 family metallopeptidase [Thermoanaerobaculia bacterium]